MNTHEISFKGNLMKKASTFDPKPRKSYRTLNQKCACTVVSNRYLMTVWAMVLCQWIWSRNVSSVSLVFRLVCMTFSSNAIYIVLESGNHIIKIYLCLSHCLTRDLFFYIIYEVEVVLSHKTYDKLCILWIVCFYHQKIV